MADVLLIYPKAGHDVRGVSVNAPLALLSIARTLMPKYSVKIIDQRVSNDFWPEIRTALELEPIAVGISSMTGTQIFHALEVSRFVKKNSEVPVIWGGMHATLCPEQTVLHPDVDYVLRGEGEGPFRDLIDELNSEQPNYERVLSLNWKETGELKSTPLATVLDMNSLPEIPWHLAPLEEYTSPSQFLYEGIRRLLPIEGSRGCPFKCTYCSEPALTRKYRTRQPEALVNECMDMVEKYNLDHIAFFDDEFFVNHKWAVEVAERINGRFSFWVQTRAVDLLRVDLKRMEQLGLRVVAPGLETGSNRLLKLTRKGETVEEYREANRRLSETGIIAQFNFMVGFPTETASERRETVSLILELLKQNRNAIINNISPLTPLPGTELLKRVEQDYGYQTPKRLKDWIYTSRGRQERPWVDSRALREIRFLYYSSYFLCTAERYAQKLRLPNFVLSLYSRWVRFRWYYSAFWFDIEIPVLRFIFSTFINPVDALKRSKEVVT